MSSETENITPQDIRDIFNRQGMNYSQIVGEDSTVVSCSLHCFNEAIEQLLSLIQEATTKAQLEILRGFRRRDFKLEVFYEDAILRNIAELEELPSENHHE